MRKPLTIFVSHPSDFITDHRVHGDGQIAYELIQRLAERGHRLHIAYTSADLSKPLHVNATLHKINCRFPSSRVQELEYMFRVRRLFWRMHHIQPFDLIHQFHPVFAGRSALIAKTGIPLVLGVFHENWPLHAEIATASSAWHSQVAAAMLNPLIQYAHRYQQRCAAALLLSTPSAERGLYNVARLRERCVLVWYPGVDVDYYQPSEIKELPKPLTILYLGNLERRKGIFVLAESFRAIWRKRPDVRLVFVGKGSQSVALQQFVDEDESRIGVEFRGELVANNKKLSLLTADLIAMPSYGEPYGIVALEAMACGKPIIATQAGGLQHLVPPEGGRLVQPGDAQGLAAAILDFFYQPERLDEMGHINRRLAEERFAWPKVIERLENVYYSLVNPNLSVVGH